MSKANRSATVLILCGLFFYHFFLFDHEKLCFFLFTRKMWNDDAHSIFGWVLFQNQRIHLAG